MNLCSCLEEHELQTARESYSPCFIQIRNKIIYQAAVPNLHVDSKVHDTSIDHLHGDSKMHNDCLRFNDMEN